MRPGSLLTPDAPPEATTAAPRSRPRRAVARSLRALRTVAALPHGRERARLERFACEVTARLRCTRIASFPRLLVGLEDDRGELVGVIGLGAPEAGRRLDVEAHLCESAEAALSARLGRRVDREEIGEIAGLAPGVPGGRRALLCAAGRAFAASRRPFVLRAASPADRLSLARLGVAAIDLGPSVHEGDALRVLAIRAAELAAGQVTPVDAGRVGARS